MSFTEQEWQELEYEALTEQMSRHMLAETPETPEIQEKLIEEHKEITKAYNAMVQHGHTMKNTGEWENLQNDIAFGSFEDPCQINQKWDYHEMFYDMNAFESDVNAQKILASVGADPRIMIDVHISTGGENYATGESIVGKVYIPKKMTHFFKGQTKRCMLLYNGCETSRDYFNIRMPWKCLYVYP